MNQDNLKKQIVEQLLAQRASGVGHFPVPQHTNALVESQHQEENADASPPWPCGAQCGKGPVIETFAGVREFFAVADFPDEEDIAVQPLFSNPSAASNILQKLLSRLDIEHRTARSFAFKCVPVEALTPDATEKCSRGLRSEIVRTDCHTIFCFGHRALLSVWRAEKQAVSPGNFELGEAGIIKIGNKNRRIFVFPSFRELTLHRGWRKGVWNVLEGLSRGD